MTNLDEDSLHAALIDLHGQVDALTAPLEARHAARLHCKLGCSECCVDGLTVFPIEAERIRREASDVLTQEPHPEGACAFLDAQRACRIYAQRPYVCRTQGLPLRWIEERAGQTLELRDICPLNEGEHEAPISTLGASECWTLGPVEGHLASLQQAYGGDPLTRLELRGLFANPTDSAAV